MNIPQHSDLLSALRAWAYLCSDDSSLADGSARAERLVDSIVGRLTAEDLRPFLDGSASAEDVKNLRSFAARVRDRYHGPNAYVRAVIEITNTCRRSCDYCEMRKESKNLQRYSMSSEDIIGVAKKVASEGITTLLLQGGENPHAAELVCDVLPSLKDLGLKVIVCLGSLDDRLYQKLRDKGADAYILKFETLNDSVYEERTGKPATDRLGRIAELSRLGFAVGSGMIADLPGTGTEDLIKEILFIQEQQFALCSVSPFIPETGTPLHDNPSADLEKTLNVVALLRVANPTSLIPAVSALQMVAHGQHEGQHKALCAGANVITRNFTPPDLRSNYRIYGGNRHVVDEFHVADAIHKARLDLLKDDSTGPITLSQDEQNSWFEGRYEIPVADRPESVYGTPTALGMRFLASAKERFKASGKGNLDIGCGDGRHALPLLLEKVPVTAVDRSPNAIDRFIRRCEFFGIRKDHHEAHDADATEFHKNRPASQFGSITMSDVLYYFTREQIRAVCENAHTLLIPGGLLFIAVEVAPRLATSNDGRSRFFSLGQQYNYTPEAISDLLGLEEDVFGGGNSACKSKSLRRWRLFNDCQTLSRPVLRSLSLPESGRLRSIHGTYGRMFLEYEIILECCKEEGSG